MYSLILAVPSLIIWGFGIPLYAWIILAKYKEDLDLIEIREKYGFLYNGYKKNFYFWESVNMYRKIWVIFISVFLKLVGVITQALVIFLVLIIFSILNIKLKPFTFQALNDMEMMSLITGSLIKNYTHSRKKLHSFSKKITLVLEKNYTRSRKKLHSFSKKITLVLEKNYTRSRKKLHSFSKKITLVLEKNYTHSHKKITLKFE